MTAAMPTTAVCAMLEAAARHEFDVLMVDDLSRLTRDAVECERAIRRLEFSGMRIVARATATTPPARPQGASCFKG